MTSPFSLTNEQDGATASDLLQGGSRRSFLRRSALGIAIAAPVGLLAACGGTTPPATGGITPTSNPMLALPALADSKTAFTDIQAHENAHVKTLQSALGSKARPEPTFQKLEQANINEFATLSQTFENVGVGAYLLGATKLTTPSILITAATILTVEARHAGFLNVLTNKPISPNGSQDKPLPLDEIIKDVTPFIKSLNGGPDPSKLNNDFDILNFALLLEFLEASFYNLNVPKFFK
jgi:hypothetical protein